MPAAVGTGDRQGFLRRRGVDLLFWALFVGLAAFEVQPFWVVHWLPGTDTGGHLELMEAAAQLGNPSSVFGETYSFTGWLQPNIVGILLARWLHPWVSTLTLARFLLSVYAVGLPLGAYALTRAFDRSRWLALLIFPISFNYCLTMGFFNYVVALPALLFVVALSKRYADEGGRLRALGLGALLGLTFFLHAIVFLVAGAMATYVVVLGSESWRRRLLGLGSIAGGSVFCVVWAARKLLGTSDASGPPLAHHAAGGTAWLSVERLLRTLPDWLLDFSKGHADDRLFLVLLGVWVALGLLSSPRGEPLRGRRWWLRVPVLAGFVSLAYVLAPSTAVGVAVVNERFASLALLLWALSPDIDPRRWHIRALLATGVVLSALFAHQAASRYRRFDDETARPLARALARLPHGRWLSYVKTAEGPVALRENTTRHLPKGIWALQNGGLTDDSFAYRPTSPLQYLPGQTPPRPDRHFWLHQQTYRRYDYVLYRAALAPPRRHLVGFARLIWHDGWWWLYEILGGEPAEPRPAAPTRPPRPTARIRLPSALRGTVAVDSGVARPAGGSGGSSRGASAR